MNASKLKEIARRTETSQRIINFIANRRRNTVYTAFSGLRADIKKADGKPIDQAGLELTFKELETMGVGKLIRTGRGTAKGFLWVQPIRDIGPALKMAETPVAPVTVEPKEVGAVGATAGKSRVTVVLIRKNQPPITVERDEFDIKDLFN